MEDECRSAADDLNDTYREEFNGNRFHHGRRYRVGNVVEFEIFMEGLKDPICIRAPLEPKSLWSAISSVTGRHVSTMQWTRSSDLGQKEWTNIADLIYAMCPLETIQKPYEAVREALVEWVEMVGIKSFELNSPESRIDAIINVKNAPVLQSGDGYLWLYLPASRQHVRTSRLPFRSEDIDLGLKHWGFVTGEETRLQQREPGTGVIRKARLWKGRLCDE